MLGDLASESECQIVLGGSPTNPTTQMNQALWRLSRQIRAGGTSSHLLQSTRVERLAQDYQQGRLPTPLQQGLTSFLQEYGHQGVCELDLGVPRWSEDPTYVLDLLVGYLEMEENIHAPDLQLQHAEREAGAMIATLSHRASQKHWLGGQLVGFFLQCAHTLAGLVISAKSEQI
jgi:pyruvate,water dikinase